MRTLTPEEQFAKAVLESVGATVTPIEELPDVRTPDFFVTLGGTDYIIEVKTREEEDERAQARHDALERGEVAEDSDGLKRKNTISGIIDWGVEQLAGYGDASALRVLWINCVGPFSDRYKLQFFNALYGSVRLYDMDDSDFKVDCLYYRDSDFFRHRAWLDAAFVAMETGDGTQGFVLLNDLSPNFERMRSSPLARAFPAGLCDPLIEEVSGETVIVRGPMDRRDANAVMGHLQKHTGRARLYVMDFGHMSVMVGMPR